MDNIKISLIFACYNVSKYLEDLYQLLITQSYKNIEIIFVEDCSLDNTKELLKSFSDSRLKIIENPNNLGAAISRNIGISHATGEYISFPDPDDLFDSNLLINIVDIIKEYSPDVIISGIQEYYENNNQLEFKKDILSQYEGFFSNELISKIIDLEEKFLFGYTNNKFYKRSIIVKNNIKNIQLPLKEDFDFNIKVFSIVDNFYILNKPYYFYKKRRNGNSLTSKFVPEYFDIHLNSILMFKELIQNKDNGNLSMPAKRLLVNRFFRYFLSAIERNTNIQAKLDFNQQKTWIKKVIESDKRISWFLENASCMCPKLKFLPTLVNLRAYTLLILLGYIVKLIKEHATNIFNKMK